MTIFTVLMPVAQPEITGTIKRLFPNDHLQLNETQWLISTGGTAAELTQKLGIYDPANPTATPTGSAVIFATAGYFGRGPTTVWDWIKAKLERPNG